MFCAIPLDHWVVVLVVGAVMPCVICDGRRVLLLVLVADVRLTR
jgi:hypothetical protein